MPGHKIGRLWKLKKDEIDEWVRKGKAIDTGDRKKLNFLDFFKRLTLPKRISSIGVIGDLITYQEQCKIAELLKWLTLPLLASAIVISDDPVTSHG